MKWPRYCEMLLGLWLLVAPWIINYGDSNIFRAVNIAAATVILLLDIVSIMLYKRYAYLAVLVIAAGLLVHAFFAMPPELAGTQNNIIIALLLLMFAILRPKPHCLRRPGESFTKSNAHDAAMLIPELSCISAGE